MANQHSEPKFDTERYSAKSSAFLELTDAYANNLKTYVSFQHVDSGREVYFKAFITNLVETYNCEWTRESIYGRADAVPIFKQNERSIAINIVIPGATIGEAYENLGNVQQLLQFMYPTYTQDFLDENSGMYADSRTITKPPYVRMKVMNLIQSTRNLTSQQAEWQAVSDDEDNGETKPTEQKLYDGYSSTPGADSGLLGFIRNCTVLHNLEGETGVFEKAQNTILPKEIELAITFGVIHETPIGYTKDVDNIVPSTTEGQMQVFPYGVSLDLGQDLSSLAKTTTEIEEEVQLAESQLGITERTAADVPPPQNGITGESVQEANQQADFYNTLPGSMGSGVSGY